MDGVKDGRGTKKDQGIDGTGGRALRVFILEVQVEYIVECEVSGDA